MRTECQNLISVTSERESPKCLDIFVSSSEYRIEFFLFLHFSLKHIYHLDKKSLFSVISHKISEEQGKFFFMKWKLDQN